MTDAADPYADFSSPVDASSTAGSPAASAVSGSVSFAPAAATPAADPYAAISSPVAPAAAPSSQPSLDVGYAAPPAGVTNTPTAKNDPIYHGAVPIQAPPDQGALTSFATGVQGVPIIGPALSAGVQDLAALGRSWSNGTDYSAEKQNVQDLVDAARQQHPTAALAGDLTGAALATAPVVAAAPAAFGAGPGGVTLGKALTGAMAGGAIGGSDAAVRSGGDLGASIAGTLEGAGAGAAAPAVGAVLSRVGQAAGAAVGRALSPNTGLSPAIASTIGRAVEADGGLAGQGAANIAAAGPRAMLVDAAPSLSGPLDTSMQRGGTGALAARQAIDARAAGSNQDLTGALDQAFGAPQGIQTATGAIRDSTATARQSAYDAAYATPIDYTTGHGQALENIVANRVPPGIIARANAQMRMDGTPSRQIMARVQPEGSVTYERMPDVRQIDYITRSLNDVSRMGDGQGALGGNTAEGRSYGSLARELRDSLRQAVPEYGTALDTAAQPIQARNALEFGSQLLRSSIPRDVAAEQIAGMTNPELAQARQGVRSQIAETMANVQRTITDPNTDAREAMATVKALSSAAAREKIGMIVGQREEQNMATALDQAARALELRASVVTNSRTFARGVANEAIERAAQPGILSRILMSGIDRFATPVVEAATGNAPADIARRVDAFHGEMARALTGPRGPAAASVLDRIIRAHNTQSTASSIAGSIPYGALTQTGAMALLPSLQHRAQ